MPLPDEGLEALEIVRGRPVQAADRLRAGGRVRRHPVEPVLRRLEPRPSGHRGGKVDLAPFRMPRGLQELGKFREEGVDEMRDALIALVLDRKSTRLNSSHM